MSKEDSIEMQGEIVKVLGNGLFEVKIGNNKVIRAHISGKLRKNYIRIILGDSVTVEMSPYDLTKGRITWRAKS